MWHVDHGRPPATFRDVLDLHMNSALNALTVTDQAVFDQAACFARLLGPWSRMSFDDPAPCRSFASNDEWPIELSFAFSRRGAKLRVLTEEAAPGDDALGRQWAGQALLRRLANEADVDIDRYMAIEDLFFPLDSAAPYGDFSLMHAIELPLDGGPVLHKAYLNPGATGVPAAEVVTAAMRRLGLGGAWTHVDRTLGAQLLSPAAREICILALDLDSAPEARVKVYLRHARCEASAIDRAAAVAEDHRAGFFEQILHDTFGTSTARLAKAPMTALTFTADHDRPTSATVYCPLNPNLPDDAAAGDRLSSLLDQSGIAPDAWKDVLRTVSGPHPERHRRISWFGAKRPDDPVVTVYAGLRDADAWFGETPRDCG